jgi:hypothetical protein
VRTRRLEAVLSSLSASLHSLTFAAAGRSFSHDVDSWGTWIACCLLSLLQLVALQFAESTTAAKEEKQVEGSQPASTPLRHHPLPLPPLSYTITAAPCLKPFLSVQL